MGLSYWLIELGSEDNGEDFSDVMALPVRNPHEYLTTRSEMIGEGHNTEGVKSRFTPRFVPRAPPIQGVTCIEDSCQWKILGTKAK
jgi:hypothetical protein